LAAGQRDKDWAVTTETTAFSNLGFKIKKYLQPGEVVFMDKQGLKSQRKGSDINQICAFLWIYTGFPASYYEGITVEVVRERCGMCLAKGD
jgi:amidophosphoribosyltransferase